MEALETSLPSGTRMSCSLPSSLNFSKAFLVAKLCRVADRNTLNVRASGLEIRLG